MKKKWKTCFYILLAAVVILFGIVKYYYDEDIINKNTSIALISLDLSILYFYAFIFSLFNNEACISGSITVKKTDAPVLYWLMVAFWGGITITSISIGVIVL